MSQTVVCGSAWPGFDHDKCVSPGWSLHEGQGEREWQGFVSLPVECIGKFPTVDVAVKSQDAEGGDGELKLTVRNVSSGGFQLSVGTWRKRKVYAVEVLWIATY